MCAGLYPNLARVDREQNVLRTRKECKVSFHLGSVLRSDQGEGPCSQFNVDGLATDWILYTELVKVGSFCHFRTCTLVTPLTVALVCSPAQATPDSLHDDGQLIYYEFIFGLLSKKKLKPRKEEKRKKIHQFQRLFLG